MPTLARVVPDASSANTALAPLFNACSSELSRISGGSWLIFCLTFSANCALRYSSSLPYSATFANKRAAKAQTDLLMPVGVRKPLGSMEGSNSLIFGFESLFRGFWNSIATTFAASFARRLAVLVESGIAYSVPSAVHIAVQSLKRRAESDAFDSKISLGTLFWHSSNAFFSSCLSSSASRRLLSLTQSEAIFCNFATLRTPQKSAISRLLRQPIPD